MAKEHGGDKKSVICFALNISFRLFAKDSRVARTFAVIIIVFTLVFFFPVRVIKLSDYYCCLVSIPCSMGCVRIAKLTCCSGN